MTNNIHVTLDVKGLKKGSLRGNLSKWVGFEEGLEKFWIEILGNLNWIFSEIQSYQFLKFPDRKYYQHKQS